MIDFRYHLVSIVAVFLALAIGIIVGTYAVSPKFLDQLNNASRNEAKYNASLHAHNTQLKDQIIADNSFAQAASGALTDGLLAGQRVVLVIAPGADGQTVSGVASAIHQAGASVAGQVILTPQFFDTGAVTEQALRTTAGSAAASLTLAGVPLPAFAPDSAISGQQAAAQVISAAIVGKASPLALTPGQVRSVLAGFGQQSFLQISGPDGGTSLAGQATMAVVIIPSMVQPANTFNLSLVAFAQDLQAAGRGTLLAGALQGSGHGSAIDLVSSGGVALTTVDNADTSPGTIIVVQALRLLLNPHATPSSYGVRPNAVPSPAPSPLPSPSVSPSPSKSPRKAPR